MTVKCFFLEPTNMRRRELRRFTFGDNKPCPQSTHGGHHAVTVLDVIKVECGSDQPSGDNWPHDDARWPKVCFCGYQFEDGDEWQMNLHYLYQRSDTRELTTLGEALPGALWFCDWMLAEGSDLFRGPDGHSLCARLPNGHDWQVDGIAANCTQPQDHKHKCWVRHGDPRQPETLTVDKNGNTCAAGAGSIQSGSYHGFLRNGCFVD